MLIDFFLKLRQAKVPVTTKEYLMLVEGMQKGRHARGFDGGRFSPVMDSPTHCFHDWVARQMAA